VTSIGTDRKELIQVYGVDDIKANSIAKAKVKGCANPRSLTVLSSETYLVQPFACANVLKMSGKIQEVVDNPKREITAAKELKDYVTFFLGNSLETSKAYRGWGTILLNPQNQSLTVLFDKVEVAHGQVDNFEVNELNRTDFEVFKLMTLAEKLEDFRKNITYIHGRDDLIFSILLTHFSVLEFEFNSAPLYRGWMELAIVGDSGQAKSLMTERIVNYIGLGRIEGSNTTLAGLVGGINKLQNRTYISWGAFPRCNKGLLFIDEIQNLAPELWMNLRTMRSSGVAKITKINSGEHEAKVRLICAANAKPYDRELADFKYGALSLGSVLNPADIRRFDLACFLSKKDLDQDYANIMNEAKEPRISDKMINSVINWAWSRKYDDVKFSEEVTRQILKDARELSDRFGASSAVPLCNASDMREKLARMVVACACLHLRTPDYIHVVPTLEDVAIIKALLVRMYSHPNVSLDLESNDKRRETDIDDLQYSELRSKVGEKGFEHMVKVLEAFLDNPEIRAIDLSGWAEAKPDEVGRIITLLSKHQMLELGKFGTYKPKPKLVRFIKRLNSDSGGECSAF
jgi:hypothetical protein